MKKPILIIAFLAITAILFAQNTTTNVKNANTVNIGSESVKKDTVTSKPAVVAPAPPIPYKADPKRVYTINLTEQEIINTLQTGNAGIIPYLKTTEILAKYLDAAQKQFEATNEKILKQYQDQYQADKDKREKFVADSTATANKKHK